MENLLPIFLLLPFTGFLVSLIFPSKKEGAIFLTMSITAGLQLVMAIVFTIVWAIVEKAPLNIKEITLYDSEHYKFFVDLYFDHITATYLIMASMLTFLIAHFSRNYMHHDSGYKRYFNTMLLYFFGIQIIALSGNFETLFIGWEILGLSSFLLIAYYRDRYLPVRNGFKVFSMYRLADIGILLSMWLLHHLFHENITFAQLQDHSYIVHHTNEHYWIAFIIALFIFLAACVKSAQFPFSSWLPRAMEGPTPSSSIFYGSIAVHIGVYLLLRTYPFWSEILWAKVLLICIGLISAIITSSIAKVQFSIKAQIAYSSLSQIGLMLVEVALGLETLVLIHMCGNAFLRSYQLLNSPSVATYILRDQFFNLVKKPKGGQTEWRRKLKKTIYVLALNEYYMDNFFYRYLWFPFKKLGHRFAFFNRKVEFAISLLLIVIATILFNTHWYENYENHAYIPNIFAIISLVFVLRAFTIRKHPIEAWFLLTLNHFWIALAVSFNENFSLWESFYYLFGVVTAAIIGYILLKILAKKETFNLDDYYGHAIEHKNLAMGFLLCCLALIGFPISTTFLGEDLMFSHIHLDQLFLMAIISINIMLAGISVMRIYARIFLGPNHKWSRSQARRSA